MVAKYLQGVQNDPRVTQGALDAVRQVESGGNPNAVSPAGAMGQYQFLPGTAKDLGIDPFDSQQSREGAGKYLSYLLRETGNLPDSLRAYNWGLGNLKKKGAENAPKETHDYVKRVMALLARHDEGRPAPTVAENPVNPQDTTPQEDSKDAAAPAESAVAIGGPTRMPQFGGYGRTVSPPSRFLGKNNPIAMVEALLQDPMSLSRGEGRNMAKGGGVVKSAAKALGFSPEPGMPMKKGGRVQHKMGGKCRCLGCGQKRMGNPSGFSA